MQSRTATPLNAGRDRSGGVSVSEACNGALSLLARAGRAGDSLSSSVPGGADNEQVRIRSMLNERRPRFAFCGGLFDRC